MEFSAFTSHFVAGLELPVLEFAVVWLLENPIDVALPQLDSNWTPNIDSLIKQAHEDGHDLARDWSPLLSVCHGA